MDEKDLSDFETVDDEEREGRDVWDDVNDPQPYPNFPLSAFGDGDAMTVTVVRGPWKPARWSQHNELDMVIENSDGDKRILAPGATLAMRMRDVEPRIGPGDTIRIEQEGVGMEKDWVVERVD